MNLNQVQEKQKNDYFSSITFTTVLKYAYVVNVLIQQFTHMGFSKGTLPTLPILLNF